MFPKNNLRVPNFLLIIGLPIFLLWSCNKEFDTKEIDGSALIHKANLALEQDIIHDFFSPPVASRIYLYPNLIAYEVLSSNSKKYNSFKILKPNFPEIPKFSSKNSNKLAAIYSFHAIANELVYTNKNLQKEVSRLDSIHSENPELYAIKKYAGEVSKLMKLWINDDGYNSSRNMEEYTILKTKGSWIPTPPDYLDAIEPHWKTIRPITLDSSSQYSSLLPIKYDMSPKSEFRKELMEVYDIVNNSNDSEKEIAKFWDCNPIVTIHKGHFSYAEKKLTPGGHWMNILRKAAIKNNLDTETTAYVYTSLSIGIFDAFISCWDTKYETNFIRPVTAIKNNIDSGWLPLLVTPNFPEYTSGHSVVSRSASEILTYCFGENYSFVDDTEVPYGMPARTFESFKHASDEAAISRFYGGIHYKTGIYKGVEQGELVGRNALLSLTKLKNEE